VDSHVRLPLPETPAAPALARRFATDALRRWSVSQDLDDVLIVVTELVQNVVEHTANGGTLHLYRRRSTLIVEVSDSSPEPPRVLEYDDASRVGGRGMRMVQNIAARWGVRSGIKGGKVIWVEIPDGAPHSARG
jgi:anti-sigma regulatory factor (Ser/Thr protein kinase)